MTDAGRAEEPAIGDQPDQEPTEPAEGPSETVQEAPGAAAWEPPSAAGQEAPSSAQQHTEVAEQQVAEQEFAEQEVTEQTESQGEAPQPSAEEGHTEPGDTDADEDTPATGPNRNRKGLLIGLGSGALVGLVIGLAFAGLAKPTFLVGPGKPDGKSFEVTTALASKDAGGIAKATCQGPDGQLSQQLPPQAVQLIKSAKPTGPPRLSLDTEAVTPVDLTITEQGQTQTVPVDIVFGVTHGGWCMKGIEQRQQ